MSSVLRSSPFKELVQRDPDICNNCFRQTHQTFERNLAKRTYRDGNDTKIWWKQVDLPPETYTLFDETEYMAAEEASHGTFAVCKCGVPHTKIRPVSREKALRYAHRIADRLEEKEVDVNRSKLVEHVERELTRPEMQGKQDEVFGAATRKAVQQ